jgi:hypothetical protein
MIWLGIVIGGFAVLSAIALRDVGYFGILRPHFETWGGAQVFTDLVILAVLSCFWMYRDAGRRGMPCWPFIALTLAAGSFGPLAYLLVREARSHRGEKSPGATI